MKKINFDWNGGTLVLNRDDKKYYSGLHATEPHNISVGDTVIVESENALVAGEHEVIQIGGDDGRWPNLVVIDLVATDEMKAAGTIKKKSSIIKYSIYGVLGVGVIFATIAIVKKLKKNKS